MTTSGRLGSSGPSISGRPAGGGHQDDALDIGMPARGRGEKAVGREHRPHQRQGRGDKQEELKRARHRPLAIPPHIEPQWPERPDRGLVRSRRAVREQALPIKTLAARKYRQGETARSSTHRNKAKNNGLNGRSRAGSEICSSSGR
jgi:hypothetical protein